MTCHWCGDHHGADQLCQRAQRGMTRRSFFHLFGAGVAGAMIAAKLPMPSPALMEVPVYAPVNGIGAVGARSIYRSNTAGTVFKLIATIEDNTTRTWTDNLTGVVFDNLPIIGDGLPVLRSE